MKRCFAEVIGTFCLVFAGTGAIVINDASGGGVSHVGIALTFGLVVLAMVYAVGDISGAHLNPAVTCGFWLAGRFGAAEVGPYLLSQGAGAFLASGVLRVLFRAHANLGATLPAGTDWQSFILEAILTFILMFVILNVSTGANEKRDYGGNRGWSGHRVGSFIRREDLRRVDEPDAIARASGGVRTFGTSLDLFDGAIRGRGGGGARVPRLPGGGVLWRANGEAGFVKALLSRCA